MDRDREDVYFEERGDKESDLCFLHPQEYLNRYRALCAQAEEGDAYEDEEVEMPVPHVQCGLTFEYLDRYPEMNTEDPWDQEDGDNVDGDNTGMNGRKRGHGERLQSFRCEYCKELSTVVPLYCPHPDTLPREKGGKGEKLPDLDPPFCSHVCMVSWAQYEIGDPHYMTIKFLIEDRVGHSVESGPAPFELLSMQMGGLAVRSDFVTDETDSRRIRNKDMKEQGQDEMDDLSE